MMTLPNRTNYIVERKAEGGDHAYQKTQEGQHTAYSQNSGNAFPYTSSVPHDGKHAHIQDITKPQHEILSPHEQDLLRSTNSQIKSNTLNNTVNNGNGSPTNNNNNNNNNNNTTTTSSNNNNVNINSNTPYDAYRNTSVERLSQEDIIEKKNYVQKHRLQPHMLQIVEYCKSEGIIPNLPASLYTPPQQQTDYSLNEFLETQGIEYPEDGVAVSKDDDEFTLKLVQLQCAYNEELEKLNRVCNEFIAKLQGVLQDQAKMRVVSPEELTAKSLVIQQKFDYVRNQLRTNVCNAIIVLQKQYNHQSKKRRRSLSKRATDVLNQWFFDHINDPYPSDEEKNMLAAQCMLSMNQVNNWFGNKRIRYKRKCLEQEARCGKMDGSDHNSTGNGTNALLEHAGMAAFAHHNRGVDSPDGLGSPNETGDDSPYSTPPPRLK